MCACIHVLLAGKCSYVHNVFKYMSHVQVLAHACACMHSHMHTHTDTHRHTHTQTQTHTHTHIHTHTHTHTHTQANPTPVFLLLQYLPCVPVIRLRLFCCINKRTWEQHKLRTSLLTLLAGGCLLVLLHFLISAEQLEESVYFFSLPLPEEPKLAPLGIDRVEELPASGTSRIPKRLHQTWKTDHIPHSLTAWIKCVELLVWMLGEGEGMGERGSSV